jgi:NAD-dependent oxidoreductase involved in siderophore biosynthesis
MANEKLTLEHWIRSLGMGHSEIAEKAKVSQLFVREATRGVKGIPMQRAGIARILDVLSQEHGRPITPDMVQDLKVV